MPFLSATETVFSRVQPRNALTAIFVTLAGMKIFSNSAQSINAPASIDVSNSGKRISRKLLQSANVFDFITEIFGAKGINDSILKNLVKSQEETHERMVIDTHITIKKGSFAEYMHAKDILWPANFFLLSIIWEHFEAGI